LLRGLARGVDLARDGAAAAAAGFTASFAAGVALVTGEHVLEQLEDRAAIQLVALRLTRLLAAGRLASLAGRRTCLATRLTCLAQWLLAAVKLVAPHRLFAAGGFRAAALRFAACHWLNLAALGLEHVLDVREQVAYRRRPAYFAVLGLAATSGFAASLGTRSTSLRTRLTGGDLGASIALAAATAVQPEHAIQEFKAEPLAAQSYAHKERSKNHLASH
jgi:hypothetical protein